MNGEPLLHAAVQHRGERSFKNTVIAKPSINYRKQAGTPVPMATGSPADFVLFFFFLSCSHLLRFTCICFQPEVYAGPLQMNASCPHLRRSGAWQPWAQGKLKILQLGGIVNILTLQGEAGPGPLQVRSGRGVGY